MSQAAPRDDGARAPGAPPSPFAQAKRAQVLAMGTVVAEDEDTIVLEGRLSGDWLTWRRRRDGSEWYEKTNDPHP